MEQKIAVNKGLCIVNDVYNLIDNESLTVRFEALFLPMREDMEYKVKIGCICCNHPIESDMNGVLN